MHKHFGKVPKPNPSGASDIADAARQIENSLTDYPDPDVSPEHGTFPQVGIDIPIDDEAFEVIEEVDFSNLPDIREQGEGRYDGAVGGVVEGGIEYLAFYKSFRDVMLAPAPKRWGIFFIKKRCTEVGRDMSFDTGQSFIECLHGLATFLYAHELYHYRFDAHCLQMEATGGLPIYRPYRRLVANRPMTEWHEESIANYYGLKAIQPNQKFSYAPSICEYLWDLVAKSPGAYAGGVDKQQTLRKDQMADQASSVFRHVGPAVWQNLIKSTIRTGMTGSLSSPELNLSSFLRKEICPVYWIDWVTSGKSILAPYAVSVSEINNDFIKRYLAGVPDHRSDHSYYRIDNGEKVKLPNAHRPDLTHREFRNIVGKAGMTSTQFYKERIRTSVWRKQVPRKPVLPPRGVCTGEG